LRQVTEMYATRSPSPSWSSDSHRRARGRGRAPDERQDHHGRRLLQAV